MSYRTYNPPSPQLMEYDPFYDLPRDHLARLVEIVVKESIGPPKDTRGPGQPAFDPRLCVKVLTYGYATGVRSSRQEVSVSHYVDHYNFESIHLALDYLTPMEMHRVATREKTSLQIAEMNVAENWSGTRANKFTATKAQSPYLSGLGVFVDCGFNRPEYNTLVCGFTVLGLSYHPYL